MILFLLFFSKFDGEKSGRFSNPWPTHDLPMTNPWSTRDNPWYFQKNRVFREKPGFFKPVTNPWPTHDLPVTTREKIMGSNLPPIHKKKRKLRAFFHRKMKSIGITWDDQFERFAFDWKIRILVLIVVWPQSTFRSMFETIYRSTASKIGKEKQYLNLHFAKESIRIREKWKSEFMAP